MAELPALTSNFPKDPMNPSSRLSVSSSAGINGGLPDLGGFWNRVDGVLCVVTSCDFGASYQTMLNIEQEL